MKMTSGEERLEEMLKAVMEDVPGDIENTGLSESLDGSESGMLMDIPDNLESDVMEDIPDELTGGDIPDGIPDELMGGDIPEEIPDELTVSDISDEIPNVIEEELTDELSGTVPDEEAGSKEEEMLVDPLALLDMSEEEIDQVLEKEAGIGDFVLGRGEAAIPADKDLSDLLGEHDELSDIQDLLSMSENHEQVADMGLPDDFSFHDVDLDSESVQDMLGLTSGPEGEQDMPGLTPGAETGLVEESKEEEAQAAPEKKPEKGRKKKEKKAKGEKKQKPSKEGKEGFGKKLARLFFGSDEDEMDSEEEENAAVKEEEPGGKDKKAEAKAGKKEKQKKEKKKKPDKKKEPDPKKAAKEKQKKEKNAEKAKKKAEKAEKAEKERRAEKKLPKKKVIVWVLFCASIAAGILLMNSVGMETLKLTEARNAFYDKDFETAYELMNGGELTEEDQLIFQQSSVVLHLQHAGDVYENHLKLDKPVMALEDLLKGVGKYQEILQAGREDLITPEAAAQYQSILNILQDKYGLSEEGAMEINALDSDYEFSLQLEAIVNGDMYQSQSEIAQQEEEAAEAYPELEDILPEEEEYLNDSSN